MSHQKQIVKIVILCLLVVMASFGPATLSSAAGISWPSGQLLPSFSAPAATLDSIPMDNTVVFEAESDPSLQHAVGRADGDGWSASTSLDKAGHMIYGPYISTLSSGPKVVNFTMMVDDNTYDDGVVATIDVNDYTAGKVLATYDINRKQFAKPFLYQTFRLDFNNTAGDKIEFRVYWHDISYVRVDRITVNDGPFKTYDAITQLSHGIGRQDGDGWSANTTQDAAGYLEYGPYDTSLAAGYYDVQWKMMIDNVTGNNDTVATLDIRDATTGTVLKQKDITRSQFTGANKYQIFSLNFYNPGGHSLEFRLYWRDTAYIKINSVMLSTSRNDEMNLFTTLAGIVNRTQPRLYVAQDESGDGGKYAWLDALNQAHQEIDGWSALSKYLSEVAGIVVYDPSLPATLNVATTIAGVKGGIIASPNLVSKLTSSPYNLPILEDLRGRFTDKYAAYQYMHDNYWSQNTHLILAGLGEDLAGVLRDYIVATKAAVFWLDPGNATDKAMADQFFSGMTQGNGEYVGWWPNENNGVSYAGTYGIPTVASDLFKNATVYGGMPRTINVPAIPAKPALQNKIYVSLVLSDGDNAQYMEHTMKQRWRDPKRGSIPIGWTATPSLTDMSPAMLNWFYQTATPNDALISGPNGMGYAYLDQWSQANRTAYMQYSISYLQAAGFRVITPWGVVNSSVGNDYATNMPHLLGITSQNTSQSNTIYNNSLPMISFKTSYDSSIANIKTTIDNASAGWNGTSPLFITVQAVSWNVTPSALYSLVNNYSSNSNYVFVRPDHFFMLYRESQGLPVNP